MRNSSFGVRNDFQSSILIVSLAHNRTIALHEATWLGNQELQPLTEGGSKLLLPLFN